MAFFGQPPLAATLPLSAGQNLADLPDKAAALANLGTLSTSNIMLNSVPIGTIIPFWGTVAPVGYLPCNGQTVNSGTFPDLVTFLGGTTSAVVPDLRGEFLRGWDNGRGLDTGRAIYSVQTDALQNITGSYGALNSTAIGQNFSGAYAGSGSLAFPVGTGSTTVGSTTLSFDASRVARTAAETRPHNVAVLYCMKAYGALVNTSTANMGNVLTELSNCTKLTQFGSALTGNGYQKLPSGLIIQWGSIQTAANGIGSVTFPIAFPTAVNNVVVSYQAAASGGATAANFYSPTVSGVNVYTFITNTAAAASFAVMWMAIGY